MDFGFNPRSWVSPAPFGLGHDKPRRERGVVERAGGRRGAPGSGEGMTS